MTKESQLSDGGTSPSGRPAKNPFPKHDIRHGLWEYINRRERELQLKSVSELSTEMPAQNASPDEILSWYLDLWAARFDAGAAVLVSSVESYDAADACEYLLDKIKEVTLADAIKFRAPFVQQSDFRTEVGIRIHQRHAYWVGLALQNAREAEEKRSTHALARTTTANPPSGEGAGVVTRQKAPAAERLTETPALQNDGISPASKDGTASGMLPATQRPDGSEMGISQTATFNRFPVTVVRDEGTPLERRWETSMGGDFATRAIFDDGPQRVGSGDRIYCSIFSEPYVITKVEPELVRLSLSESNVAYWKAKIMPRSEWIRLGRDDQSKEQNERTRASNSNDQAATSPRYPNRAAWFQKELALREWSVHDFQAQNGPDWKTSRKILDGLPVSRSVLEKVVIALSLKKKVTFQDIPHD